MSTYATVPLTLPHCAIGPRKIRLIYLSGLTSFRLTACPQQSPTVPLYLGADIFSDTDIRIENHPRYHAKFAKKGYATKVNFSPAFRFHGLKVHTTSNSLWFYSIEGLFRVAFEMYSKREQLALLENLQEAWKSQINNSPLKLSYDISAQQDSAVSGSITQMYDEHEKATSHSPHCQAVKESVDRTQTGTGLSGYTRVDHDYCAFLKNVSMQPAQLLLSTIKLKLQSLEEKLSSESQGCTSQVKTVLLLLENIDRYLDGKLEEKDLTQTVLALLEAKHWGSVYSSHLTNSVAQWLGQQFHGANSIISQQVESFKVQHIERITDLPPAEELATELFPEAMQTLMLHWMGLSDESTLAKRHSEYPILLLILEFANHNLITGAAHVLYSSLLCR